jgi:hypothetical protein
MIALGGPPWAKRRQGVNQTPEVLSFFSSPPNGLFELPAAQMAAE